MNNIQLNLSPSNTELQISQVQGNAGLGHVSHELRGLGTEVSNRVHCAFGHQLLYSAATTGLAAGVLTGSSVFFQEHPQLRNDPQRIIRELALATQFTFTQCEQNPASNFSEILLQNLSQASQAAFFKIYFESTSGLALLRICDRAICEAWSSAQLNEAMIKSQYVTLDFNFLKQGLSAALHLVLGRASLSDSQILQRSYRMFMGNANSEGQDFARIIMTAYRSEELSQGTRSYVETQGVVQGIAQSFTFSGIASSLSGHLLSSSAMRMISRSSNSFPLQLFAALLCGAASSMGQFGFQAYWSTRNLPWEQRFSALTNRKLDFANALFTGMFCGVSELCGVTLLGEGRSLIGNALRFLIQFSIFNVSSELFSEACLTRMETLAGLVHANNEDVLSPHSLVGMWVMGAGQELGGEGIGHLSSSIGSSVIQMTVFNPKWIGASATLLGVATALSAKPVKAVRQIPHETWDVRVKDALHGEYVLDNPFALALFWLEANVCICHDYHRGFSIEVLPEEKLQEKRVVFTLKLEQFQNNLFTPRYRLVPNLNNFLAQSAKVGDEESLGPFPRPGIVFENLEEGAVLKIQLGKNELRIPRPAATDLALLMWQQNLSRELPSQLNAGISTHGLGYVPLYQTLAHHAQVEIYLGNNNDCPPARSAAQVMIDDLPLAPERSKSKKQKRRAELWGTCSDQNGSIFLKLASGKEAKVFRIHPKAKSKRFLLKSDMPLELLDQDRIQIGKWDYIFDAKTGCLIPQVSGTLCSKILLPYSEEKRTVAPVPEIEEETFKKSQKATLMNRNAQGAPLHLSFSRPGDFITLGRGEANPIVLDDAYISDRHATISYSLDYETGIAKYKIMDGAWKNPHVPKPSEWTFSKKGIYLLRGSESIRVDNDKPESTELKNGDLILLGKTTLEWVVDEQQVASNSTINHRTLTGSQYALALSPDQILSNALYNQFRMRGYFEGIRFPAQVNLEGYQRVSDFVGHNGNFEGEFIIADRRRDKVFREFTAEVVKNVLDYCAGDISELHPDAEDFDPVFFNEVFQFCFVAPFQQRFGLVDPSKVKKLTQVKKEMLIGEILEEGSFSCRHVAQVFNAILHDLAIDKVDLVIGDYVKDNGLRESHMWLELLLGENNIPLEVMLALNNRASIPFKILRPLSEKRHYHQYPPILRGESFFGF